MGDSHERIPPWIFPLPLATSGNQGTQANTMAYCHSALVFGQLLLNKGVHLLSALHGLVAQRGNFFG